MAKKGTCMTSNSIGFQQTTKTDNLCACMKGLIAPFCRNRYDGGNALECHTLKLFIVHACS